MEEEGFLWKASWYVVDVLGSYVFHLATKRKRQQIGIPYARAFESTNNIILYKHVCEHSLSSINKLKKVRAEKRKHFKTLQIPPFLFFVRGKTPRLQHRLCLLTRRRQHPTNLGIASPTARQFAAPPPYLPPVAALPSQAAGRARGRWGPP